MKTNSWQYFKDTLPPENVIIEATTSTGNVVELVRCGNLLWAGDMYIYYQPIMWRIKQ